MAACELMRNYTTRYCLFAIDSDSDLAMLPTAERMGSGDLIRSTTCCIGSRARSSDGKQYVLNGSNQWIPYNQSGGSGGPGDDAEITDGEIEDLFNGGSTPSGGGDEPSGDDTEPISNSDIEQLFG